MNKRTFIFQDNPHRESVKAGLYACLKHLPTDKKFRITVEPYKHDKTAEQRAFFHTLCGIFGDAVGYSKDDIKEYCKAELMGKKTVVIAGKEKEITESSETLKRDEYSQLIETCYRLAAEAGVILPNARWAA